jgi:hypothetical protein
VGKGIEGHKAQARIHCRVEDKNLYICLNEDGTLGFISTLISKWSFLNLTTSETGIILILENRRTEGVFLNCWIQKITVVLVSWCISHHPILLSPSLDSLLADCIPLTHGITVCCHSTLMPYSYRRNMIGSFSLVHFKIILA